MGLAHIFRRPHAPLSSRGACPRGFERGTRERGGSGPSLWFETGCGLRRPTQAQGLSAAVPRTASLSGASPRFSPRRQDGPGDSLCPRTASAGPLRTSPPAHVCAPGRWSGRTKCKRVARCGDKIASEIAFNADMSAGATWFCKGPIPEVPTRLRKSGSFGLRKMLTAARTPQWI
jgi:hypothetical protein